jgi:hypothetical protein
MKKLLLIALLTVACGSVYAWDCESPCQGDEMTYTIFWADPVNARGDRKWEGATCLDIKCGVVRFCNGRQPVIISGSFRIEAERNNAQSK